MVAFTKKGIEKLEPKGVRYDVYDRDSARSVPGLLVRVFPSGVKSFQVFRKLEGKAVRVTLGRFPGTKNMRNRPNLALP